MSFTQKRKPFCFVARKGTQGSKRKICEKHQKVNMFQKHLKLINLKKHFKQIMIHSLRDTDENEPNTSAKQRKLCYRKQVQKKTLSAQKKREYQIRGVLKVTT